MTESSHDTDLRRLADRIAIEETMYHFAAGVDHRDWDLYRSVFTDEIDLDYSSWRPGSIGRVRADDWVARAQGLFPGLQASQHALANVRITIDGDEARVRAEVRAEHVLAHPEGDVFTLGGHYDDRLVRTAGGWRIQGKRLVARWMAGNRLLLDHARAIVAGGLPPA
jgi:3-phenylpropionate/cinnamic acid dioxygenase small subunit